jgi:hypothetical protein
LWGRHNCNRTWFEGWGGIRGGCLRGDVAVEVN